MVTHKKQVCTRVGSEGQKLFLTLSLSTPSPRQGIEPRIFGSGVRNSSTEPRPTGTSYQSSFKL